MNRSQRYCYSNVPMPLAAWSCPHRIDLVIVLVALVVILSACDSREKPVKIDPTQTVAEGSVVIPIQASEFRFGFDLRSSPQEDSRQYQPFLDYLSRATGYRFRLYFVRKDQSVYEQLGKGVLQFIAVGAVSSIKAQEDYGAIPVARGLGKNGRPNYRAMIVVAPNSSIRSLKELRGKRMAFGNIDSTQGHLIPRIMLEDVGVSLKDLAGYRYTGSHHNCAKEVMEGKSDACGMQDGMAEEFAANKRVRILAASREYPSSGIVAGSNISLDVISRVQQALLDFQPEGRHANGMYHWDRTEMPRGFAAAAPKDYEELRTSLIRLGMLPERGGK